MHINKAIIMGNVGNDPIFSFTTTNKITDDGKELVTFSVATSESWKEKVTGEKKQKTEWHKVVIYNKNLLELVRNYVRKGSKVYIEGSIYTNKWTDKNGVERATTEIVLNNFNGQLILLDSQNKDNQSSSTASFDSNSDFATTLDDEVPF